MSEINVLFIDDDKDGVEKLIKDLKEMGYNVIYAGPEEAQRLLEEGNVDIDVVVIDVRLKGDDSKDISGLKLARKLNHGLPKVITTHDPELEITYKVTDITIDKLPESLVVMAQKEAPDLGRRIKEVFEKTKEMAGIGYGTLPGKGGTHKSNGSSLQNGHRESLINEIERLMARYTENWLKGPVMESIENVLREVREIKGILIVPDLDNYEGYVCAKVIADGVEMAPDSETGLVYATNKGILHLGIWFQPDPPVSGLSGAVDILDGQDADEVSFQVLIKSDTLDFDPPKSTFTLRRGDEASIHRFAFGVTEGSEEHRIWVEVFQKNRFIQCLPIGLRLSSGEI